jgi:hypothetical protein
MERQGEPEGSDGVYGGVDVGAGGYFCFPSAVVFDLVDGPTREGKVGGTTVLEDIPGVGGNVDVFAF